MKARFAELGMAAQRGSPEWLEACIRAEFVKWTEVIRDGNVEPAE